MKTNLSNLDKIKTLEQIREDYFSICGYEKDFNETIEYKIRDLKEKVNNNENI